MANTFFQEPLYSAHHGAPIHVYCPFYKMRLKPSIREFVQLSDYFNLTQHIFGPAHDHGHTHDLVLSFAIPVYNVILSGFWVSVHKPFLHF